MSSDGFKALLTRAASGAPLTREEAAEAFHIILKGQASEPQVAAFVSLLHLRGETSDEIVAAASVLRDNMVRVHAPPGAIDMVGTGGDGVGTLNISTAASIVTAACGVKVAKHGNRAQSSKSGAADVLSALGVRLSLPPAQIAKCIETVGLGFMFAPDHHAALAQVGNVRKQLGFRTIFNLLGPLCNPALVDRQLVGVFAERWLKPYADAFRMLVSKRAWIVHGFDGLDEISISGPTKVVELDQGHIREFSIRPEDAGLPLHALESILGADANTNAAALRRLLDGERGAYHDIVALNSAAALIVAGKVTSLRDGVELAQAAIASGAARTTLDKLVLASMPENVLGEIAKYKLEDVRVARTSVSLAALEARAKEAPGLRSFKAALEEKITRGGFALIAEIKKASPSKGLIRPDFDPPQLAKAYECGGAACLSVLTDAPSFQGANEYLVSARAAVGLPVLRKDFMFEPYQVVESRALGADCILIIMAAVSDSQAGELQATARHWGMDVLFEVHDRAELERALAFSPQLVGINNRDLVSFNTSLETTEKLAPLVPKAALVISESGIHSHEDMVRLSSLGVKSFLVGESLMRKANVERATRDLLGYLA